MKKVLIADLPWKSKQYAGRSGMRWAHTSTKTPVLSFRPFPYYMAYCAAVLEKHDHKVCVVDALAEHLTDELFYQKVTDFKPDYIIAETHTPSFNNDVQYMQELKKVTSAKLIFTGPHATALPEEAIKYVDHVVVGEYEYPVLALVSDLTDKPIVKMEPVDINEFPWPARKLFKMELYNEVFCRNYPNINIIASRGCPYSCSYCNVFKMNHGRKVRLRNPFDVIEEMVHCTKTYKPKEFYFDDDNIDVDQKWLKQLMDLKIEKLPKVPFSCMGHVNISEDMLEKMYIAGCRGIKFGIESANNDVLKRLSKGMTIEMAKKTIAKCKELNIITHLTYCIGLPGDTVDTVKETLEFAKNYGDHYQISIAAPFPGTPLYEEARRNGWLKFDSWNDFDGMEKSIINYPDLPSDKLYELYKEGLEYSYKKTLKSGEWKKYVRMIYQERGWKGLINAIWNRGPNVVRGK